MARFVCTNSKDLTFINTDHVVKVELSLVQFNESSFTNRVWVYYNTDTDSKLGTYDVYDFDTDDEAVDLVRKITNKEFLEE